VSYSMLRDGALFSERRSLSPVRLSSICLSSVTLVRRLRFSGMFLRHLVHWPAVDIHGKFYGDRSKAAPPAGGLNARGVVKYSDFGPIGGYISKMVQDREYVGINH